MKVYTFIDSWFGYVFTRIDEALKKYAPIDIEFVGRPEEADLQIVHIICVEELKNIQHENYIIFQYCYYSTKFPKLDNLCKSTWEGALLVISYLDLPQFQPTFNFKFYSMPLGADPKVFYRTDSEKDISIFTTGHVAETESLDKIYEACKRNNQFMYHLNKNFGWDTRYYKYIPGFIPDNELRKYLNRSRYVNALRWPEGFEALAIEGLFCGARPLVYDFPAYDWYREHAITIKHREPIIDQIAEILKTSPESISEEEYKKIVDRFNWETIIVNFWNRVKEEWSG